MTTLMNQPLSRRATFSPERHGPSLRLLQTGPAQSQSEEKPHLTASLVKKDSSPTTNREQWGNSVSRIAHDLLNILTAIQGNAELAALSVAQSSSQQKNLQNIFSASQRGYELLGHILQGLPLQEHFSYELDLCVLVDEILELFQATLPSTITLEKIDHLKIGRMVGNSTQLFRMFSNLLTNAIQAMQEQAQGRLTIILDRILESDFLPFRKPVSSSYLRLVVRDTGHGMSVDLCRKIFHPFFTTQQDGTGLGLGLAIVKEVVTDHKGVVTVDSHPQNGTTFTVYFPELQEA